MPNSTHRTPGDRSRTAIIGTLLAIVLSAAAFVVTKGLPRDTADSLYWMTSTLTVAAILTALATLISVLFHRQSLRFHIILAVLSAIIGLAAYPISIKDQNEPVIFSFGLLAPLGIGVFIATFVVILLRILVTASSSTDR